MRRGLPWARSTGRKTWLRLVLTALLAPGLLSLQVSPVAAIALPIAHAQGDVESPKQQSGTAEGLPHIVAAAVTKTAADRRVPSKRAELPKQALPVDIRSVPSRAEKLSVATGGAKKTRSDDSSKRVQNSVSGAVASPLEVEDLWPLNGALLGTVTPTLTAHGTGDESLLQYEFTVCELPDDDDEIDPVKECLLPSDQIAYSGKLPKGVNSWKVPVGELKWAKTYAWWAKITDPGGNNITSNSRSFVTGARQPTITSQLAINGANGQEFEQTSGNYTTAVMDASVPTAGPPLNVRRSYNSKDARRDGIFGAGWSTRFDMKVQPETSGAVLVTYPDGRTLRFAPRGDGGFQPPPGMFATFTQTAGGGWRLMDKSSTSYMFNSYGRLVKVSDNRGRVQDFVYTDGKLTEVRATGGRSLTFTWNGSRVASVSTDPVNGTPLTWTYEYQGDKLHKVCTPQGPTHCTTYDYTTGSGYQGVIQDDEPVGYWRLGEPANRPPSPTPNPICTITPQLCESPTTEATSLGWGAGPATYEGVTLAEPGALAGSTNTAARLSGTSKVRLPEHLIARLGGQVSLETWFKTTSSGVIAYATDATGSTEELGFSKGQPFLYVGVDGKLRGQFRVVNAANAVIAPITSPGAVNNGAWHHVILTGSGASQTLYLDGAPVGSLNGTIDHNWLRHVTIGNGRITSGWPSATSVTTGTAEWGLNGYIDEAAVYDRPLTGVEAAEHYAARQAVPHLMSKITLPSGRVWAENTYDTATDRLKTHTDQHGGVWKIGEPTPVTATGMSTVTVTDPQDGKLVYEHDAWRGYRLVTQTDQLGKKTSYEYDAGGYSWLVADPNENAVVMTHDKRGNVLTRGTCSLAENPATEPPIVCLLSQTSVRRYGYYRNADDEFDPRNDRVLVYRDPRSAGETDDTYATKWEYNEYGEPLKETAPVTADFPNGRSTLTAYTDGTEPAIGGGNTPAGLVKSAKDARGKETTYRYTSAGDLAEQTSPSGLVTKFTYDAVGRMLTRTEVSEAHPTGAMTTFTYDGLGRMLTQTGPGVKNEVTDVTHTAKVTYTYDADGNKLTETLSDLTGGDPERVTAYTYDASGRVETVTDPEGGVVRTAWDATGARVSITDQLGVVRTFGYTKRGEPATTTLKNWTGSPVSPQPAKDVVLESRSYDPGGRLAAQVDAMGRKTSYTYFADNLLSQVIGDDVKLNGLTTTTDVVLEDNVYDAAGHLTKQVKGGGKATTEYVYDAASRLTSTTFDPATLKRKTTLEYDEANNVTKKTLTGAGTTRTESTLYVYNALNQVTRQTVENGDDDLVSTSTYDDRGLLVTTTDPRGNASGATAADFTTEMRYDIAGQLVEKTSPRVKVEKTGSAADGRPTEKYGYDTAGLPTQTVDAEGRRLTSAFDKAGRLTSAASPPYTPPGGEAVTPKVGIEYDAAGRKTKVTDERGYVTSTEYDALGNPVRVTDPGPSGPGGQWVTQFDLLGEPLATIDPTGARDEATYDDLGRKITQTRIERRPTTAAYTTTLTYDTAGNLTKSVAPGSKTTGYEVNAAGEVTATTDPNLNKSTVDYDLAGRTVKVTDPLKNATEAVYDLAGRQTGAKDLDATGAVVRSMGFGYDAAGNATSGTSGEGHVTRRTFDALGRMTSLVEPVSADKSITTTFGYDATSARTRLTDGRGNATWTTYNVLGLAESVIEPATTAHPNAADRTWTTGYDAAGNAVTTLQPGGVRIDRVFDHLGQVTKQTGAGAGVDTPERNLTYDDAGRLTAIGDYTLEYNDRSLLTKVSKATNQVAAYAYDGLGNTTQRVDTAGTSTYTYDNASRLKTATDPVTGRTWTYGYDNADRLTSQTSANPVNTQSYTYDAVDRLTSHTLKNSGGTQLSKIAYDWDKDDNLVTKTTSGTAGAGVNTYGYDHSGRLTSWTAPDGKATAYEWDDAGNRTKAGDKTFVYDERNRLLSGSGTDYTYTARGTVATETTGGVTKNLVFDAFDQMVSDGDASYGYDALGRMTSRTKGVAQQRFVYSGLSNDIVTVTDGAGALQAKYGRDLAGGLLSLQEGTGPALGTMTDLHGDLVGTFSGTALVDSTAYDPFGEVLQRSGTQRTLGYQGEYTDPDTGKVNMHARWYRPGSGTFTSRDDWTLDPVPSIQGNRYAYVNGAPLVNTDSTGHLTDGSQQCGFYTRCAPPRPVFKQPIKPPSRSQPSRLPLKYIGRAGAFGVIIYLLITQPPTLRYKTLPSSRTATPGELYNRPPLQRVSRPQNSGGCKGGCGSCTGRCSPAPPLPKRQAPVDKTRTHVEKEPPIDTKSDWFKNDPNNVTKDKPPTQAEIDWQCQTGPCRGSYTGHNPIDIGTVEGDGGSGISCQAWNGSSCAGESCSFSIGFSYSSSLSGCLPKTDSGTGSGADSSTSTDPDLGDRYPDAPLPPPITSLPTTSCDTPNSFVPGTKVLMADGTTKPIEDVEVGDQVIAADPETGQTAAKRVSHLITGNGVKHLVRVVIDTSAGEGRGSGSVVATDGHPFWVVNLRSWVKASELLPGMVLRTSAGTYVQIKAIKKWTATQRVHNLTIDDFHTYHVVAGDRTVLVHNDGPLYSDEECWDIADRARDEAREGMSNTQRNKHVMMVGAVDCVTGAVAVGRKRSEKGPSTHCAEDLARDDLISRGSRREDIRYGHPAHPDSMKEADFCDRCRGWIDPTQVPPDRRWTKR
ncbi:polymorphic toxin-type HINT domain-containing protein [Streptosporangium sp. NPDC048047]|uniref:polymorphic toxin-type HINT domain-containing protein n=1 Tax=Streptosporangium sp. NPDC048047 TaxID=3155748 RepID=UPI003441CE06